ncbi:MAG: hypothetical protein LWX56_02840 [Ignavibacteria bacterium]|nr:hypothetical protein [Ignavibacteria bacterium]
MKQENYNLVKESLLAEKSSLLNFFKSKLPLYHNSNIFFRDLQFTISAFLELKGQKIGYTDCESLTKDFLEHLVKNNEARQVQTNAWVVNMPQFKKGTLQEVTQ